MMLLLDQGLPRSTVHLEGLNGELLALLLVQVLAIANTEIEAGAVVSVTPHQIRVRLLPIGH